MDRKTIIALSFGTIVILASFAGMAYYSNGEAHGENVKINTLNHYIKEYDLKAIKTITHKNTLDTVVPATMQNKTDNNTVIMRYTFYKGSKNVTGQLLHIYIDGKLIHESLLLNSSEGKNYNYTVATLYSISGKLNTFVINNNKIDNSKNTSLVLTNVHNKINPAYAYNQVCNIYSTGIFGWFLSFNNDATQNLITDMTSLSLLAGYLGLMLGFSVVGSVIAFLASAILAIGAYAINNLNNAGGLHGVYFDGLYGQLSGYGTPWTHAVPWWA